MKNTYQLFIFFQVFCWTISLPGFTIAQSSDYPNMTQEEKVLLCEKTLANLSGKPEEIELLINIGESGIKESSPNPKTTFVFQQSAGIGYYYKQDFETAKRHFQDAYSIATKNGLITLSIKPLGNLIHINHYLGKQEEANAAAETLTQLLRDHDSLPNKGDAYYNLGMYFQQQKFYYSVALDYFLKSIALHKPVVDTTQNSKLRHDYATKLLMVAEIYIQLKQANKALEYLEKATPFLHQSNIVDIAAYGKYIRTHALLNNKQQAQHYYNLLNAIFEKSPGKWSEIISSNLKMAELSLTENNYQTAKIYIDKADAQSKIDNKEILTSAVQQAYGEFYLATQQYTQALAAFRNAEKGIAQFNKEQYLELLKSMTTVFIQIDSQKVADEYFKRYVNLSDSLTQQKMDLNLAEMEAIFQNKDKQQQIELQQTEISTVNEQKLWLIFGLGILVLVLFLLYIIYRNKKRTADILNAKSLELERLNSELTAANQSKAKLFSIISHDLRSPISQVNVFLKLQQQNEAIFTDAQKEKYNQMVQDSTTHLLETMEDLLAWSKSQMNQFTIKIDKLSLHEVLNEILQFLQLQIDAKNIIIRNEIDENMFVHSDENILKTILRNLLQNAIKASPQSETIIIQYTSQLTIINNGIHFSMEDYQSAIHSLFQNNSSSGLGLKLVDELSRKINITIQFDNLYATGTKALILFPESNL